GSVELIRPSARSLIVQIQHVAAPRLQSCKRNGPDMPGQPLVRTRTCWLRCRPVRFRELTTLRSMNFWLPKNISAARPILPAAALLCEYAAVIVRTLDCLRQLCPFVL